MIISIFYYTIINIIVKPGCYIPGFFIYKRYSYENSFLTFPTNVYAICVLKLPRIGNDSNYFRF